MHTSTRLSVIIVVVAVLQVAALVLSLISGHSTLGHLAAGAMFVSLPVPAVLYRSYRLARSEGR